MDLGIAGSGEQGGHADDDDVDDDDDVGLYVLGCRADILGTVVDKPVLTVFSLDWGTSTGGTYSGVRGNCWRWGNRPNKTVDDVFMSVHSKVVLETISRCFGWMRGTGVGRTLGVARGG